MEKLYFNREKTEFIHSGFFENYEHLRTILENAPDALYIHGLDCKIIATNKTALQQLGYTLEELLQLTVMDIDANQLTNEQAIAAFENLPPGETIRIDGLHKRKDGTTFPVEVNACKLIFNNQPIFIGFARDISNQKLTENALRESENKFRSIYENSNDAIGASVNGVTVFVNPAYLKLFGYDKEDKLMGKSILNQIAPEEHKRILEYVKKRAAGEDVPNHYQTKGIKKNGEIFDFEINISYFSHNNQNLTLAIIRDISERIKSQNNLIQAIKNLEESEKKYKNLAENTQDLIIRYNKFCRHTYVNQAVLTGLNITADQIIGKTHKEMNFFSEDICVFWEHAILNVFETGKWSQQIFDYNFKGHTIVFDLRLFPELDENKNIFSVLGVARNITEQRKSEILLQENQDLLNQVGLLAKVGGWKIDLVTNTLTWTTETYRIHEVDEDFIPTVESAIAFYDANSLPIIKNAVEEAIAQGKGFDLELGIITTTRKHKVVRAIGRVKQNKQKQTVSVYGVFQDITEQKKTQEELLNKETVLKIQNEEYLAMNEELNERNKRIQCMMDEMRIMMQKAEESDKLKTAFLQNMSHEIRTPMNAIVGFSNLLNKNDLSPEKRKSFTDIIISSSNQLLGIISDILTISMIETGKSDLSFSKISVNSVIIELLSVFKHTAANQNLTIYAKQGLQEEYATITTDVIKFKQVLTNLISNALKFTHNGFVEFGYVYKDDFLEFYVKDTGIGIKPEMHEKIFERFRQADASLSKKYGGTGLGLAISKANIELLDGRIWLESEYGKGTTFYFTLPYNSEQKPEPAKTNKKNNYKILIAEDEEFNYLYLEELLMNYTTNVLHAKNGIEAVELCFAHSDISLVLMDIKMPKMDGIEATRLIKEKHPQMPVIAQTAYATEFDLIRFSNCGFDDYITKPIEEEILIKKIKNVINL